MVRILKLGIFLSIGRNYTISAKFPFAPGLMLRLKYREYFSDAAFRAAFFIFDTFQMTKKNGINPKHSKLRGELAELRFMTRAAELGLRVIKPWVRQQPLRLRGGAGRTLPAGASEIDYF